MTDVKMMNAQIGMVKEGLAALQQVYMMRAASDRAAAQKAMDIASLHAAYTSAWGVYQRSREMLLAEHGEPHPGGQGFIITDVTEEYRVASENLLLAEQLVPGDIIEITAEDITSLQSRPDVLAALTPIARLAEE